MTAKFGELTGNLTLTVGNQSVDLGNVRVPITGYTEGYRIRLNADLNEVRDAVQELFRATERRELDNE